VRIIQNTQIHSVGRIQRVLLSKELVNVVTAAFNRVNAFEVNKCTIFDLYAVLMRQLLRQVAAAGRSASKAFSTPLGEP
jgi:hypothetical protein